MKRVLKLQCIALLLVCGLATADARQDEQTKPKVVAFAQDTLANDWRLAQVEQFRTGLEKQEGVRFIVTDAGGRTAKQIKDIEDLVAAEVDVLVTSPRDAALMTPVISSAYRQGIPVVLLSRTIGSDDYTSFIHADNRKIARKAADFIIRGTGGKGTVLMLTGVPGATTVTDRSEPFLEVMASYPEISVVTKVGNYLRADAIRVVEDLLMQGVRIDAIYAQSDSMASGAIMALKMNGIDPRAMTIVGIDYINEARELIKSGELDATYIYPTAGAEGANVVLQILAGEAVAKEIVIDSVEVTSENVDHYAPIF